tara:strand:+ start:248 stop:868 length:621 start_codon:yes stop_codon:yes gene_type:complete
MKPRLFNQESKMRLLNQKLYMKAKIDFKKKRIIQQQQQQQQQPAFNINIVNNIAGGNGFEKNKRIKDIYNRLELLAPPQASSQIRPPDEQRPPERLIETEDEAINRIMNTDYSDGDSFVDSEDSYVSEKLTAEELKQVIKGNNELKESGRLLPTPRQIRVKNALQLYEDAVEKTKKLKETVGILTPRQLRLNAALKRESENNSLFM